MAMLLGGASTGVKDRRMFVLKTMIGLLAPDQRFNVAARMVQDVLGAAVDGVLGLTDSVSAEASMRGSPYRHSDDVLMLQSGLPIGSTVTLLEDVFELLGCDELKFNSKRSRTSAPSAADGAITAATTMCNMLI